MSWAAAVPLRWVGDANKALCEMPEEVRLDFGRRLNLAQRGTLPPGTMTWQGLGPGIFEMVEEFDGDAYRAVYLARYKEVIYVLHAFQRRHLLEAKPDAWIFRRSKSRLGLQ